MARAAYSRAEREAEAEKWAYQRGGAGKYYAREVTYNKLMIVTLYKYETGDRSGRTLELDIVGSMIVSEDEYNQRDDESWRKQLISYMKYNAGTIGLWTAMDNAESEGDKFGLEVQDTEDSARSFDIERFVINGQVYI